MHLIAALLDVQALFSKHVALFPMAGVTGAGLAFAFFRAPMLHVRPFGVREFESIMNFSSLGTLRCICGAAHGEEATEDRRQFCRSCGCEVIAQDEQLLSRQLSRAEIVERTRTLRSAAIRARYRDLPPSITSISELNRYLTDCGPMKKRQIAAVGDPLGRPQHH